MSFSGSSSSLPTSAANYSDAEFDLLQASMQQQFSNVTAGGVPLFRSRTTNLFQVWLDAMSPEMRQFYTCANCRNFVNSYGGLVSVTAEGQTIPLLWNPTIVPEIYVKAVQQIASIVEQAPINGIFLCDRETWGIPETGHWRHLSVTPSHDLLFKPSLVKSIYQVVAEKQQDYKILTRGLAEFPLPTVRDAYSLLTTEALYRSEKCISVAKWLLNLHEQRQATPNQRIRENLTWLAVAAAPPGFCHIRSSMIGTLLEDIQAGLPFAQIKSKFDAKMDPLQYQRPTAPPSDGNIAQAEKIFEQLKTAGALERRFAKLSDLQSLWVPNPYPSSPPVEKQGIFGHLRQPQKSATEQIEVPPIAMTWEKFSRTVLPTAETIEYFVPTSNQAYMGMVTAQNPEAPPIIQWDFEDNRNPVTWYFYVNPSAPDRWNLKAGVYQPVTAIVLQPSMWNNAKNFAHQGEKVFFILKDAKDTDYHRGCGFFPVFLKSEYHGVRATMEAYAKNAVLTGQDQASACGIGLQKGSNWNHVFRVTAQNNLRVSYQLDRWD
jgi:hypothetical protein